MIHHYICINNDTPGRTNSIHSTHLYLFIKKKYPYRPDLLKGLSVAQTRKFLTN